MVLSSVSSVCDDDGNNGGVVFTLKISGRCIEHRILFRDGAAGGTMVLSGVVDIQADITFVGV